MSLLSGTYTLYNVSTKTLVGSDGKRLMNSIGGDLKLKHKWVITRCTENTYTVQTPDFLFTGCQQEDCQISVSPHRYYWEIKATTDNPRHFTIGVIGKELYWGSDKTDHDTLIISQKSSNSSWIIGRQPSRVSTTTPILDVATLLQDTYKELVAAYQACNRFGEPSHDRYDNLARHAAEVFGVINNTELRKQVQEKYVLDTTKQELICENFKHVRTVLQSSELSQRPLRTEDFSKSIEEAHRQLNQCCHLLGLDPIAYHLRSGSVQGTEENSEESTLIGVSVLSAASVLGQNRPSTPQHDGNGINGSKARHTDTSLNILHLNDLPMHGISPTLPVYTDTSEAIHTLPASRLAPSFENLDQAEERLDKRLKAILVRNLQMTGSTPDGQLDWTSVISIFNNSPRAVRQEGEEYSNTSSYTQNISAIKWKDSTLDGTISNEVLSWFTDLIKDNDVQTSTMPVLRDLALTVASTAKEYQEETFLGSGVLRYPKMDHPHFMVYQVKLVAWSHFHKTYLGGEHQNGIRGQFLKRIYTPNKVLTRGLI